MMKNAEEIREQFNTPFNYDGVLKCYRYSQEDVEKMMIEFAKMHAKEALRIASENASIQIEEYQSLVRYKSCARTRDGQVETYIVAKDSILNAYPESNIE